MTSASFRAKRATPEEVPRNQLGTTEVADAPLRRDEREELISAFEELRLADEELRAQSEAFAATSNELDRERRKFRELFEFAPDAYLITPISTERYARRMSPRGTCSVSTRNFSSESCFPSFFEESARRQYSEQLDLLCDRDRLDDWEMWLHSATRVDGQSVSPRSPDRRETTWPRNIAGSSTTSPARRQAERSDS